ncbi:2TM domain-containing protein [Geodermatophilus amargosae]|uniref:2TM domain-containing protein n=1 Tax=Geodermatophilus amargosae TaxID=1296565 RepID=A0A1I7D6R8_9ACTN|nr:2TM domain-containing protein [Geodermatophilus amargosae]SFU07428.1 2TM domain-containing protein [Geodermatophilus amargosae]
MDADAKQPTAEDRARRRVEAEVGLAVHRAAYLAVNAGLLLAAGGFAGSWWRLAGWGSGLAVHTGCVLAEIGRLVERELARERVR